ncbi:MAG: hypothetical protein E7Z96_05785 [Actinomycetaceae bacterium]|nr:hypothetical protein [Actinomycetaceae bacterium]
MARRRDNDLQHAQKLGITGRGTRITAMLAATLALVAGCSTTDGTTTSPATATETTTEATTPAPRQITITLTDDPLTAGSAIYAFFLRDEGSTTCTFIINADITVARPDDTILAQATIPAQSSGTAEGDMCTISADVTVPGDADELVVTVDQGHHLAWQITASPDVDNVVTVPLEPENFYNEGF